MVVIASISFTFHVVRLELNELNILDNIKSSFPFCVLSFII